VLLKADCSETDEQLDARREKKPVFDKAALQKLKFVISDIAIAVRPRKPLLWIGNGCA